MTSPCPGLFSPAWLVTGPDDREVPLDALDRTHLTSEYAPDASGCHRTFRLLATG